MEFVWCRVEATLPTGETRTAVGDYLNADGNRPRLMCGIFNACDDLGLPEPDDETCLKVSTVIDHQLILRPWAVLHCPEMTVRLTLVTPPVEED